MYMSKITAIAAAALLVTGCGKDQQANARRGPDYPGPSELVRLKWQGGSQNQWKVDLKGVEKAPKDAKTIIPQGDGPTMFVVDIDGHKDATFKNPNGLSVWEGENAKSSPQQGINSDQIIGPIVTKDGRKLVFFDLNTKKVTLNYALHFNNNVPTVDPIIENNP